MNANAWAAMGMSISDASRPADWKICPESHRIRTSCYCRTCFHSSVLFPDFISQHKVFNCSSFIFSFLWVEKLCGNYGSWSESQRSRSGEAFSRTCHVDHCLSMPCRKRFAWCEDGEEIRAEIWTFAWLRPILCLVFLLCIVLFSPESSVSLSTDSRPRGWMDLREL